MTQPSYDSPFGIKKPHLNYSGMWSYTLKSFLTFFIIAVLMGCSFYFGFQAGQEHIVKKLGTVMDSKKAQSSNDNQDVVKTNPVPENTAGSTITVNQYGNAGEFNGYRYFLTWQETWKTDAQGVIDQSELAPVSSTPAVLEKIRMLDDQTTKIAENITFNEDKLGSLTNFTEDQSVVVMALNCRGGCDSQDYLVLNLINGKATILSSVPEVIEQRFKQASCSTLGFQNTIQNNALFMCINSNDSQIESIYKYNLSSGTISEIETLAEEETIVCEDGYGGIVTDYSNSEGIRVAVCKKNNMVEDTKIERQIIVKDVLKS